MTGDESDVQGNILRGYTHLPHVTYMFFRIVEPDRARGMLAKLVDDVTTDASWRSLSEVPETLNLAFTYSGLAKLGRRRSFDSSEFTEFREGMCARAREYLVDRDENDPDHWEPELRDTADVLCTVYWDGTETGKETVARIHARLAAGGLELAYLQRADTLKGHRERFGFKDGYSQPVVEPVANGAGTRATEGEGVLEPWNLLKGRLRPEWRPVRVGEFLLGHLDEDDVTPGEDDPSLRNGTFMVWRKLRQHVDRFEQFLDRAAGADPERRAWLEAKVVGRWRNGTSLIQAPYRSPQDHPRGSRPDNAFVYGADPAGVSCPVGAHVRRAYPRDGLGWWTHRTRRHRIIRRGVPYDDRDEGCGLIFVCFNASISRQFELIQGNWLMDGDAFGLGADRDLLTGYEPAGGKMTIQGDRKRPATFLSRPDKQFVTTRGGYYLFVPGIEGLRRIASA